jgi:hypothetical protein
MTAQISDKSGEAGIQPQLQRHFPHRLQQRSVAGKNEAERYIRQCFQYCGGTQQKSVTLALRETRRIQHREYPVPVPRTGERLDPVVNKAYQPLRNTVAYQLTARRPADRYHAMLPP